MSEPERRPIRRPNRYTKRLSVQVEAETYEALCAAADAAEISVADTVRLALARGLPLLRDAQRRERRRTGRRDPAPG